MTIDNDDLLNSVIASLGRINAISLDDIPNIDLYMDQLTTFMDERLKRSTRHPDTDKILTKTMINNYAKNDLLPPPIRKKYSKDHIILLIFIYYLKNILSISDIQTLLEPLKERFHVSDDELNLGGIYERAFELQEGELEPVVEDLKRKYEKSLKTFEDTGLSEDEKKRMQMFSFIILLSYDVYVKKLLIEKIIDNTMEKEAGDKEKPAKEKKKK
ncbi:MAG: DUF1836 domain-containing protein [Butyrivibrio sp.]|uniref:DUF1836 domain-containing protein n=1 Tax=Butyrivibrio hungatei TaxID=185008 RepID=A0A1G5AC82_9FIRM|nr:DUF1836 domain-containing protein [Butyrivibrio hungatei]MCR4995934.1 DUF1836 domain-containing protein [Butyrivibrio sp.]SCX75473.1 protein of unknown function [Butyrivibrio hungatei]